MHIHCNLEAMREEEEYDEWMDWQIAMILAPARSISTAAPAAEIDIGRCLSVVSAEDEPL